MDPDARPENKADLNVLEQVLKTFLSIDKKIMELHKCSSDDFLSLNRALKLNHQKAMYITNNIKIAFEKIGPEGNIRSLQFIRSAFVDLRHDLNSFEQEVNTNMCVLEKIQANFSLMFVPINNFRQNLTSLKLLLANIKLTNNLYERGLKSFSDVEASRIEAVINKVKESCPVFEENIYVIQKHIKSLYTELGQLKEIISGSLFQNLEDLYNDLDIIEKYTADTLTQQHSVEKITQNCQSSVGSIITNLQYHDIIRQKMEHIQQTHTLIIKEINGNQKSPDASSQHPSHPYFLQIPQIIEIQTAQLLHTNKDYQNAIDQISKKMIEIGKDMTTVARIYKSLSLFEYKGRSIAHIKSAGNFDDVNINNQKIVEKFSLLSEDVRLVQRIVNELFDKFRDMEMIENAIEQSIIEKISFGNLLVSEERETASQAQQILKLYADNHFEKRKIRTLFENTSYHLKEFVQSNSSFIQDKKSIEKIKRNLQMAQKSYSEIIENLFFLESIQDEVIEKSLEVEKESNEVVGKVKYYDFFEKTIDNLIGKFESINLLIKDHGHGYHDSSERSKGLEQIEKYYTMKSERIIHNQSILSQGNRKELQDIAEHASGAGNTEGNDVEFF